MTPKQWPPPSSLLILGEPFNVSFTTLPDATKTEGSIFDNEPVSRVVDVQESRTPERFSLKLNFIYTHWSFESLSTMGRKRLRRALFLVVGAGNHNGKLPSPQSRSRMRARPERYVHISATNFDDAQNHSQTYARTRIGWKQREVGCPTCLGVSSRSRPVDHNERPDQPY